MDIIEGKVFKYGDDVNTDVIIPARYLNVSDPKTLATHCMEDIDQAFSGNVEVGDVIVAGANFGCGSSREHAPLAIKFSGVQLVIAKSFARIFYRNAINIGLNILENEQIAAATNAGDILQIDYKNAVIFNKTQNLTFKIDKFDPFIQKLVEVGGLVEAVKRGLL